jgi:hypothetical protein
MLAAMGPQVQKYLWWKKYLTAFQMVSELQKFIVPHNFHFLIVAVVLIIIILISPPRVHNFYNIIFGLRISFFRDRNEKSARVCGSLIHSLACHLILAP